MSPFLKKPKPAVRIAVVYLVFSVAWILLSDRVVAQIATDGKGLLELQNAKGLLFVAFSALLLFFTAARDYRRIQETLREKEQALAKLTALNEAANEGMVDYEFKTDSAVINEPMRVFMGVSSLHLENYTSQQRSRIHPDDRDRLNEHLQQLLQSGNSGWQDTYRYRIAGGAYRDVNSRGYLIRDQASGKPLHMVFTVQDVSDLNEANAREYRQQMEHRQQLSREILKAQEEEKNRWAQELHDNVCQTLTVAGLWLEEAAPGRDVPAPLQHVRSMVEKALNDIRHLSASIKPPELSGDGLCDAVEALLENMRRFSTAAFHFCCDEAAEQRLQNEQKIVVYRVIQEQVNNILKYAAARNVWVRVYCSNNQLFIVVSDDGCGFSPEKNQPGIGLKNIRSRVQLYGGEMVLESAPGQGCTLQAVFSLN